jgi:putative DNA-invertase from lambdoid prophage Rac
MAVYGYVRVSTQRQAEKESPDVQRRQIEGYCLMHGFTVDRIVIDEGISGSVPITQRPAAGALFKKLRSGDSIIAAKLDRLFRSALDALQTVEELKTRGVHLHLLDLGGDIAGNGLSKLFLTIAAAFAEAERDRIRERVTQTKRDQKARNCYLGGIVPFGYRLQDSKLVPNVEELVVIADVLRWRKEGLSLRSIAWKVGESGFRLSHMGVAKILERSL